jgi:guanylate kinase
MNAENGKLFVISGSSGVGKGTLLKELLAKNPALKLSISVTTRNPRPNEVDGVNYFFVTREEFETSVKNGEFLEWAEFNGNYYGTKETYVKKTLAKGENLILEIETKGALQIKQKLPNAILIFILPPSLEELEQRLRGRNTEDEDTIQGRLHEAFREIECSNQYNYRVVNDDLNRALFELETIINQSITIE